MLGRIFRNRQVTITVTMLGRIFRSRQVTITVTPLGRVFRGHLVSIIITDITTVHGTCPPTKKMLRRDKTDDFEGKKLYDNTKIKASVVSWRNN